MNNDSWNIPIAPSQPGKHIPTEAEKAYIRSFAVDGVIPFDDYLRAVTDVINYRVPQAVLLRALEKGRFDGHVR